MHVAGIMVVIARFQWVGVMDYTNSSTESASQSAAATAATDGDDDDDDDKAASPRMQYFIKVLLYSCCFML